MFPFVSYAPTVEFPLSGDVTQDLLPGWFSAMKGVPEYEQAIVTEVWSYGAQLGTLTDVVLQLAQVAGLSTDEVRKLAAKADETQEIKDKIVGELEGRIAKLQGDLEALRARSGG